MDKIMQKIIDLEMKIVLLIGIAMMGVYWVMFYDNGEKIEAAILNLDTQIQEEANKKITTTKIVKELDELLNQKKLLQESTLKFYEKFPLVLSSSETTRHIQDLVAQTNAKIKEFKPGTTTESELFVTYPIGIIIEGSFADLALFIFKLAKSDYIFKIKDLGISSKNSLEDNRRTKDKSKSYDKESLVMNIEIDAMSLPKEKRL